VLWAYSSKRGKLYYLTIRVRVSRVRVTVRVGVRTTVMFSVRAA